MQSSSQLESLRQNGRQIFAAALRAVDAFEVTQKAITREDGMVRIVDTRIRTDAPLYVLSIGKAALPMARALDSMLGNHISGGVVTSPQVSSHSLPATWTQFKGGHPLPNVDSLAAAKAAFSLLDRSNSEQAVVILAVSGGGSALIEWPALPEISLTDLQDANRQLISCGASISEVNTVRRAFSAVKGGKLIEKAPQAQIITLIISDTNPGDEASVASGPSLAPNPGAPNALQVITHYRLNATLPPSVVQAIKNAVNDRPDPKQRRTHYVLADNNTAIQAATVQAKLLGFDSIVDRDLTEQAIDKGCDQLIERLRSFKAPLCLISGGEFSCPVRGDGTGGRNSETVLRCAMKLSGESDHVVVLSAGTDGIDGNSPAAGAIADENTLRRSSELGLDASAYLARSDAYHFFESLGDAIVTGPTGTNVRDIRIVLKTPRQVFQGSSLRSAR